MVRVVRRFFLTWNSPLISYVSREELVFMGQLVSALRVCEE